MSNNNLYRGKRKNNKEWVYGCLVDNLFVLDADKSPVCYIMPDAGLNSGIPYYDCWEDLANWIDDYEVIPETVGQYSGKEDKNGCRIFKDDVVSLHQFLFDGSEVECESRGVISYQETYFSIAKIESKFIEEYSGYKKGEGEFPMTDFQPIHYKYGLHEESFEVLGNIHDNPELIG